MFELMFKPPVRFTMASLWFFMLHISDAQDFGQTSSISSLGQDSSSRRAQDDFFHQETSKTLGSWENGKEAMDFSVNIDI